MDFFRTPMYTYVTVSLLTICLAKFDKKFLRVPCNICAHAEHALMNFQEASKYA